MRLANAAAAAVQLAAVAAASYLLAPHASLAASACYVAPLLALAMLAAGWPFAPPAGRWPRSRAVGGLLSTAVWLALSAPYAAVYLLLKPSEFGAVLAVFLAFAWGTALEGWPLRHLAPWRALAVGAAATLAAMAVGGLLSPPPQAAAFLLWAMAALAVLSPPFVLQAYPLRRLVRQPRVGAGALLASLAAAAPPALAGVDPAYASSAVLWAVAYSWSFAYFGSEGPQPGRGVKALAVVGAASAAWTLGLGALGADVEDFNLALALPLLVAHNALWLRFPLPEPLLPGLPLHGQRDFDILWDWLRDRRGAA